MLITVTTPPTPDVPYASLIALSPPRTPEPAFSPAISERELGDMTLAALPYHSDFVQSETIYPPSLAISQWSTGPAESTFSLLSMADSGNNMTLSYSSSSLAHQFEPRLKVFTGDHDVYGAAYAANHTPLANLPYPLQDSWTSLTGAVGGNATAPSSVPHHRQSSGTSMGSHDSSNLLVVSPTFSVPSNAASRASSPKSKHAHSMPLVHQQLVASHRSHSPSSYSSVSCVPEPSPVDQQAHALPLGRSVEYIPGSHLSSGLDHLTQPSSSFLNDNLSSAPASFVFEEQRPLSLNSAFDDTYGSGPGSASASSSDSTTDASSQYGSGDVYLGFADDHIQTLQSPFIHNGGQDELQTLSPLRLHSPSPPESVDGATIWNMDLVGQGLGKRQRDDEAIPEEKAGKVARTGAAGRGRGKGKAQGKTTVQAPPPEVLQQEHEDEDNQDDGPSFSDGSDEEYDGAASSDDDFVPGVESSSRSKRARKARTTFTGTPSDALAQLYDTYGSSFSPSPSPEFTFVPLPSTKRNGKGALAAGMGKSSRGRKVPTYQQHLTNAQIGGKKMKVPKTNGGKRSFVCEVDGCGKCFLRSEHLKRHVRSLHSVDKPYKCPYDGCEKSFSRRDNLAQHCRVHL